MFPRLKIWKRFLFYFVEVELIYHVGFISAIQQIDSVIEIYSSSYSKRDFFKIWKLLLEFYFSRHGEGKACVWKQALFLLQASFSPVNSRFLWLAKPSPSFTHSSSVLASPPLGSPSPPPWCRCGLSPMCSHRPWLPWGQGCVSLDICCCKINTE